MKLTIKGKNVNVSDSLREKTEKKVNKLDRYFHDDAIAHVTLGQQRGRDIAEIMVSSKGALFRAEESSSDMYTSIEQAVDLIERQIRKNRTKIEKRIHSGSLRFENVDADIETHDEVDEDEEFKIVRVKSIDMKPMSAEEAILQMNLIGHSFFVFTNGENMKTDVVYKRKHGDYGLIESE